MREKGAGRSEPHLARRGSDTFWRLGSRAVKDHALRSGLESSPGPSIVRSSKAGRNQNLFSKLDVGLGRLTRHEQKEARSKVPNPPIRFLTRGMFPTFPHASIMHFQVDGLEVVDSSPLSPTR